MPPTLLERVNALSGQEVQRCVHCHTCTAGCPSAAAMEYGPDRLLRLVQFGQEERLLTSRDVWLCLGCGLCGALCPNEIDIAQVVSALRQMAHQAPFGPLLNAPDCAGLREALAAYLLARPSAQIDDRLCAGVQRLNRLGETIATARNISGDDNAARLLWSQNLERVPQGLERRAGAHLVYFVGCVASLYPRSYGVPQAMARLLAASAEAGGDSFTTLGGQEWCCGYPLLSLGRLEAARSLIEHNVEQVRALGAERIVFACPSCYHMWKHIYPQVLDGALGLDVLHATEWLDQSLAAGTLRPRSLPLRVTYHDPCDLGRKSGVFDAPRRVLARIPGLEFVELGESAAISTCCGGGGNLESFDPEVVSALALGRLDRACEALFGAGGPPAGALALVSACQQCERTLTAAVRRHAGARQARLRVLDVAEVVTQAVEGGA